MLLKTQLWHSVCGWSCRKGQCCKLLWFASFDHFSFFLRSAVGKVSFVPPPAIPEGTPPFLYTSLSGGGPWPCSTGGGGRFTTWAQNGGPSLLSWSPSYRMLYPGALTWLHFCMPFISCLGGLLTNWDTHLALNGFLFNVGFVLRMVLKFNILMFYSVFYIL